MPSTFLQEKVTYISTLLRKQLYLCLLTMTTYEPWMTLKVTYWLLACILTVLSLKSLSFLPNACVDKTTENARIKYPLALRSLKIVPIYYIHSFDCCLLFGILKWSKWILSRKKAYRHQMTKAGNNVIISPTQHHLYEKRSNFLTSTTSTWYLLLHKMKKIGWSWTFALSYYSNCVINLYRKEKNYSQ